jgi:hypothetical protein
MAVFTITNDSGVVLLTAFNAGTTVFVQCTAVPEAEPVTLYHDGVGVGPTVGDTVYSDAAGTTPFYTGSFSTRYSTAIGGNNEFSTGVDGVMIVFSCK